MINKDSIVTAYDEHLTLVEWLQKVENALNNAVLTNLGIAKLSDKDNVATYQVTATFADNTSIASDSFTLPSTDIVTAFGNLRTLVNGFDTRITHNTSNVDNILDIVDIAYGQINAYTLQNSINGSDDVIVDVDKTNEKLVIHLSPELTVNTITADIIKTDSFIHPATIDPSEGNISFNAAAIEGVNITIPFAKWRVSNGKLSIVATVRLEVTSNDDVTLPLGQQFGSAGIILPEKVGEKLVPIAGFIVDNERVSAFGVKKDGTIAVFVNSVKYNFMKYSNTSFEMDIGCEWTNQVKLRADFNYLIRVESNYML